eukprot:5581447-Prymnesium_polylepis.1
MPFQSGAANPAVQKQDRAATFRAKGARGGARSGGSRRQQAAERAAEPPALRRAGGRAACARGREGQARARAHSSMQSLVLQHSSTHS